MKALLIAEKPSLRREIEEVYKKHRSEIPIDITFTDQRGHLVTLLLPDEMDETQKNWSWDNLPFIPEHHGGWQYKVIEEKKQGNYLTAQERFNAIKHEIKTGGYDFVINAGDPDQEGELLVRLVLKHLGNKLPVKRFWTNDLTEGKIVEALKNLRDDDNDPVLINLLSAAYGRQHSDYRFGMNISRAATLKLGIRVASGRVKTPILSIVCKREREIADFKPTTVYGIKVDYIDEFSGLLFNPQVAAEDSETKDEDGDKKEDPGIIWFKTREEAEDLINNLSYTAEVVKYESKQTETYAPKLFKLATAQIAAGKLGYKSDRTLEIIQSLYEKGFVSYPRTDCEYLSSNENFAGMLKSVMAVPELAQFVLKVSPSDIARVQRIKKWVNDKALQDAGHSALVPTDKKPVFDDLSDDEQAIYRLICRQFVAIFMPNLKQDKTLLIANIDGNYFKSTGKTLVDPGFSVVFGTEFHDMVIPEYQEGEIINVDNFVVNEKTSTCPKRYTDADLIAVCENPIKYLEDESLKSLGKELKIGTPATRAGIINELIVRDKYLQYTKDGKKTYITPTESGMMIYDNLKDCKICKVDMTGEWEILLDKVRSGLLALSELEKMMQRDVNIMIEDIKMLEVTRPMKATKNVIGTCPVCGKELISTEKSIFCAGYKDGCTVGVFHVICDARITDEDFLDMLGGKTITKTMKKSGSSWKQNLKYDHDTHKIVFVKQEARESEFDCPACGGALTDNGSSLSCKCGFKLWKTVCEVSLNDEQISKLLKSGKTDLLRGLKSKAGKRFDAYLVLKADKSGTEMKFPQRD